MEVCGVNPKEIQKIKIIFESLNSKFKSDTKPKFRHKNLFQIRWLKGTFDFRFKMKYNFEFFSFFVFIIKSKNEFQIPISIFNKN